jgi:hypothetical protein
VETVVEALPERVYVKAPGKRRIAGVTLNVYGLSTPSDYTDLYFDIKNENGRYIELDLENAYLEYKGIRYKSLPQLVDRSLRGSVAVDADLVGQVLTFEALPKTAQDVTVLIPVKTREWSAEQNEVADFVYNFNMDIDFTY